jgi:uncharacterized protein YutE (UPF0331/DUF86 family)
VVPAEFAKQIEGMAGFRNILAHRYFKVDSEIVYKNLQERTGDLELFVRYLTEYLARSK